tara:strand:+ start:7248 stop:8201 length:954 start_codon:yes stop_codon:yes gene_type:complete
MSNQPANQTSGQNNMSQGNDDTYYNNEMQGSYSEGHGMGTPYQADKPYQTQMVMGFGSKYGTSTGEFFAPGIDSFGGTRPGQGTRFLVPQGDMFGAERQIVQDIYNPQRIQAQQQLMLQNAQRANLTAQRGVEGQLSQMGLGSLGGAAGALSGQATQGALNEAAAIQAGQQMAQQAQQAYMGAQAQLREQEAAVGTAISQAYGTAYDVVTATAPEGWMISEPLEADLAAYAQLVGQQVMAGEMTLAQAQMELATYPDRWAQATGQTKYQKAETGRMDELNIYQRKTTQQEKQAKQKAEQADEATIGTEEDTGTYYVV